MKKIINDIRKKGRLMMLSCCTILGLLLVSCDYWHDSYEGCEELLKTHLKVQFIYDMNMKFADAFPHEVKNVTLMLSTSRENWLMSKPRLPSRLSPKRV